ncbi:Cys-tRNA(Pro) deacylase [Salinibius halmophilus]|uniref:Cys-tRNA(Pro) deacylase n=1 Tax=Salinibius halmophilus TaxID=1853216 RepID=UPI000E66B7D2|nr:Cys-tRNA(Pro) deacylase [Salinibius halmophilus]
MTPAVALAKAKKINYFLHQYEHDPKSQSYGLEAAEKLSVEPPRVFKTLVADVDGKLVVAVIPVVSQLSLKALAKAAGGKKAAMADKQKVQRATGYVLGGVSPLGQKQALPLFVDTSAQGFATVYVSAGKRGLEIELAPSDLLQLANGQLAELQA